MSQEIERRETSLQQQMQWSKLAATGDIVPDAYRNKPANVLVAIGFGASMGLSPAESLYRISVIKGKPTMSAELIASQVRRAGHKLRIAKDEAHKSVTATIIRADDPDYPISVTRDMQWAHDMGLDQPSRSGQPSNYQRQGMTMLTWRAITAVAREACPEALYGAGYTPDELSDVTESRSEHIEATVEEPSSPEVVATPEQREKLFDLLKQAGVDSRDKACAAINALVQVDSDKVADIPDADVLMLLDSPELVVSRTKAALEAPNA
jgi:hypothetical protein